ncbi:MAG TPA: class I SAM-dependent methyltransferase [Acidimicrobiales bacterium]|jgi:predicted O-methyltransferase YrrM
MDPDLKRAAEAAKGFMPPEEGEALHDAAIAAARAVPNQPWLEVGTYCGKSTIYLGAAAHRVGATLFTVDHHRGSEENQQGWEHHDASLADPHTGRLETLPTFRRNIWEAGLDDVVVAIVGQSPVVARHWNTPLAFLFIDGGHGSEPARSDYEGWTPKVAAGGTLAIHDVFPDPADGGRPPHDDIYRPAVESGLFRDVGAVGSLRILERLSDSAR